MALALLSEIVRSRQQLSFGHVINLSPFSVNFWGPAFCLVVGVGFIGVWIGDDSLEQLSISIGSHVVRLAVEHADWNGGRRSTRMWCARDDNFLSTCKLNSRLLSVAKPWQTRALLFDTK